MHCARLAVAVVAIGIMTAAASNGLERLVLKDGTALEGNVVEENEERVSLSTWKGIVEIERDRISSRTMVADGSDRRNMLRDRGRKDSPEPYIPAPEKSDGGKESRAASQDGEMEIRIARPPPPAARDAMRIPGSQDVPAASAPIVARGAATAATGGVKIAAVGMAGPEQQGTSWQERIARQMERKVTVDFSDTSLEEAANFLGTLTGVTIVLDPRVEAGKRRLTMSVRDMEAGNVLAWMTRLTDTGAVMKDKAIFITSVERAIKELEAEAPPDITLRRPKDVEENLTDFPAPDVIGIGGDQKGQGNRIVLPRQ